MLILGAGAIFRIPLGSCDLGKCNYGNVSAKNTPHGFVEFVTLEVDTVDKISHSLLFHTKNLPQPSLGGENKYKPARMVDEKDIADNANTSLENNSNQVTDDTAQNSKDDKRKRQGPKRRKVTHGA